MDGPRSSRRDTHKSNECFRGVGVETKPIDDNDVLHDVDHNSLYMYIEINTRFMKHFYNDFF